jgi:hypothetical protein
VPVLGLAIGLVPGRAKVRAADPATTETYSGIGQGNGNGIRIGDPPKKTATTNAADRVASIYGSSYDSDRTKSVVFMVDTSGSMIGTFGDLKANLKQSILAMPFGKGQSVQFDIVTFSDEKEPRVFSKSITDKQQLIINTPDNLKKAIDFIDDSVACGGTLPMPAIQSVLAMEPLPGAIFFMTDGLDEPDRYGDIGDAFRKVTADGKLTVNCIHFKAQADPKLEDLLKLIAKESHGEFKQIDKTVMQ